MASVANSPEARDIAYHLHPYTNLRKLAEDGPLVIARGEGIHVYDTNDKPYIEGLAGLWCAGLGFSEQRLVEAATRQMEKLPFYHAFTNKVSDVCTELAERLVSLAPVPMSKAIFESSGSQANDTVIKIVWYYNNALGRPEKKKFISRKRGYHGVTLGAASLTGLPYAQVDFDVPFPFVRHVTPPHTFREMQPGEDEAAFVDRLAQELDDLIEAEGSETVAAFIAEPVQGAGGVILPPEGYFPKIQAVLNKHDVLMIADEVICGFGRTGNWWGSQTFDIKPNIMSMAKQLTAAYMPLSAVMIDDKVFQVLADNSAKRGNFGHGYTYSGHPVPSAVALETLRIYEEDGIIERVAAIGPHLQAGLRALGDHPLVGEARGIGLIGALELVADKETKEAFPPERMVGPAVVAHCQRHGLILRNLPGDVVAVCPPMIITTAEIDELLKRLGAALDDAYADIQAAA